MPTGTPVRVPKLCGGDLELGNFVTGLNGTGRSDALASRACWPNLTGLAISRPPPRPRCRSRRPDSNRQGPLNAPTAEPTCFPGRRETGDGSTFRPTVGVPTSTSNIWSSVCLRYGVPPTMWPVGTQCCVSPNARWMLPTPDFQRGSVFMCMRTTATGSRSHTEDISTCW